MNRIGKQYKSPSDAYREYSATSDSIIFSLTNSFTPASDRVDRRARKSFIARTCVSYIVYYPTDLMCNNGNMCTWRDCSRHVVFVRL